GADGVVGTATVETERIGDARDHVGRQELHDEGNEVGSHGGTPVALLERHDAPRTCPSWPSCCRQVGDKLRPPLRSPRLDRGPIGLRSNIGAAAQSNSQGTTRARTWLSALHGLVSRIRSSPY